ncbi:hypothetical protein JYQ62_37845 [Nostoc sp. UHCC 0702]|nr:hypothetical protein JYQ62_37845 [Nostoc sp. UHCC 0702]
MTQSISSRVLSQRPTISSADLISTVHESDEVEANKNTSQAVARSKVQMSAGGLQIIHATNRRIRIRATDSSLNTKLESIAEHLRQQKAVKEAYANEQTGSLVVTFDENRVSLPQMLEILEQFNIQQPETSPQTLSNIDPFAAWKSVDFWKEQTISFIPLMTGLAVTGGLGISGLAAIPVYMVTSNATRRVIDYLEPQVSPTENSKNSVKEITSLQPSLSTSDRQLEPPLSNNQSRKTAQPVKIAYKVVHAIPGRIRIQVPRLAQDRAYGRRLERLMKTDPQVVNVRINSDAGSIAIAYQPSDVSLSHWVSLMELALETNPPTHPIKAVDQQLPQEPVNQPDQAIDATTISENQTLDLSTLWADMKFSGLSFSLACMANLPL